MAIDVHTIEVQDGSGLAQPDRVKLALFSVANGAGGAGATVQVSVTFGEPIATDYHVEFDAGQDVLCFATNKSVTGFTLNMNPRLAANAVAAGSVFCRVTA